MKDTRPVHMGTFEQYRKQLNSEMEMLKKDTISMQKSINGLYNSAAKLERISKVLIVTTIVSVCAGSLAILSLIYFR